jgi:hypothetical protein
MGRFSRNPSYGHRIAAFSFGGYRISWVVDFYYDGSRQRHPRRFVRDVDDVGAKRFCKKWNVSIPQTQIPKEK